MWNIYRERSSDLSFAIHCLFCKAISSKEFQLWVERVINDTEFDNIPLYMFDLVTFDDYLSELTQVIGFVPHSELNDKEEDAILGITFLRGIDIYDPRIGKEEAIKLLRDNPHIYEKYKIFFPFIKLPELNADVSK